MNPEKTIREYLSWGRYAPAFDAFIQGIRNGMDRLTINRFTYSFLQALKTDFIPSPDVQNRILMFLESEPAINNRLRNDINSFRKSHETRTKNFIAAPIVNVNGAKILLKISVNPPKANMLKPHLPESITSLENNVIETVARILFRNGFITPETDPDRFASLRFNYVLPVLSELRQDHQIRLTGTQSLALAMALALVAYILNRSDIRIIASGIICEDTIEPVDDIDLKSKLVAEECPDLDFLLPVPPPPEHQTNYTLVKSLSETIATVFKIPFRGNISGTAMAFFNRIQKNCLHSNNMHLSRVMYDLMQTHGGPHRDTPDEIHYLMSLLNRFHLLKRHFRFGECLDLGGILLQHAHIPEKYVDTRPKLHEFFVAYSSILTAVYRFDDAKQVADRADLSFFSPTVRSFLLLITGENAMLAGRYDEALACFREAERVDPENHRERFVVYMSRLDMLTDQPTTARRRLESLRPDLPDKSVISADDVYVLTFLIKAHVLAGAFDTALKIADGLLKSEPTRLRYWPGPVWRRYAVQAAYNRRGPNAPDKYLMPSAATGDLSPILAVHHLSPYLEKDLQVCRDTGGLPPEDNFLKIVEPLSWEPVKAFFRPRIDDCLTALRHADANAFVGALVKLIGDIYEK